MKNFYSYLNFFTLSKEDISDYLKTLQMEDVELTVFQFHLLNSRDDTYYDNFYNALKFFLHEDEISILPENEAIILGDIKEDRIIKQEEFDAICQIIRAQTGVGASTNEGDNPADARAAQIMKKIKEGKQKVEQVKGPGLSFTDLVASLAAKGNGLNAINIWDLTYFAFNDQFKRMQWIEEYENAMKALMAGAKKESVKLVHWIRPMNEENKK